ncbi:hypothetical protein [Desulfosporosinus shakirovi]|uniref:hypothetical protein n=1 Tax=Desulfosporosinus shakirovi TaxID=2885154 RepID=UPI001E4EB5B4|nr:hypothetical protein [Desulfosporosinus sp. SRJS8]MCB8816627.1 hypothetical protein [Desulfosporosinus sp. SRJS8]
MSNTWRRPPRNEIWRDLQALALWILIIGVVGYVLFPSFFKDIYSHLADPVTQTSTLNDQYTLNNSISTSSDLTDQNFFGQDYSSVSNALYNNSNDEVSIGYWVIFVADGEFKQLSVSSNTYTYLLSLIESDVNAAGKITMILSSNGKISKYNVSQEIYAIITNMALIVNRNNT